MTLKMQATKGSKAPGTEFPDLSFRSDSVKNEFSDCKAYDHHLKAVATV